MALLDRVTIPADLTSDVTAIKKIIVAELWKIVNANKDMKVFTANFLFIHKTFRISDLTEVFVLILGPDPTPVSQ